MASFPLSEGGLPLQAQPASAPRLFPQAWLARRVPWPQYAAGTPLNVPQAALSPAASGSLSCLRLAYAFFYRPPSEAAALLREAVRVGQEVWLADFKLAERNLEWPACALSRLLPGLWPGSEGSRALRRFLQAGGLEGLVAELLADRAQERPLQLHRQARLMGGAAVLLCLRSAS